MKNVIVLGALLVTSMSYGQVGIGTTSPTVELDIESSSATTSIDINNTAADGDPEIHFQLSGTTSFTIGLDDTDDFLKIGTTAVGTSTQMILDGSDHVGIGSYTPYTNLNIYAIGDAADNATIDNFAIVITNPANDTGEEVGIGFRISTAYDNTNAPGGAITFERTNASSVGDLNFKTAPSSGVLTTRMTIDESGFVGIGTTSPGEILDITSSDTDVRMVSITDSDASALVQRRARSGTTIIQDGNALGHLYFQGYDGNSYETFARISSYVDGTPGDGDIPGKLVFLTSPDGTASEQEVMTMEQDGDISIGNVSGDLDYRLDIYAFDDAANGEMLSIANGRATPTDGDYIIFRGLQYDDASNWTLSMWVEAGLDDVSNTTEDSYMGFATVDAGTSTYHAKLTSTGDWIPYTSNSFNLGNASYLWKEVFSNNAAINTSDKRLKKNITPIEYGLKEVMLINPVSYQWNNKLFYERYERDLAELNRKKQNMKNANDSTLALTPTLAPPQEDDQVYIGVIAQELQQIMPEMVNVGDDENQTLGVRYTQLIPVLIKAIQEQQAQIENLEQKITELESGETTEDEEVDQEERD